MQRINEDRKIGTIYAESPAIQSKYGDFNLHFQHHLIGPLRLQVCTPEIVVRRNNDHIGRGHCCPAGPKY